VWPRGCLKLLISIDDAGCLGLAAFVGTHGMLLLPRLSLAPSVSEVLNDRLFKCLALLCACGCGSSG
jgi:hypothetical protein